jgi:NCS2 family nucleobase:cation symporter-2
MDKRLIKQIVKPAYIIYGLDDMPPFFIALFLGIQHIFTMASMLILPVVLVQEIGGSLHDINSVTAFSMIAIGIGTILQSFRTRILGSGYLIPNLCGPSYFAASLQAGWIGGLPLMHGMVIIAGCVTLIFSRFVHKLKFLFPTEIIGLVVLMVGVSLIPLGASKFVGVKYSGDPMNPTFILIACITLFIMVGLNVWTHGKIRIFCVIIGFVVGYGISIAFGVISSTDMNIVAQASWLSLPGNPATMFDFKFDFSLIIPFVIVSLVASLKCFGNIITAQKINDESWTEPDMKSIGNGLFADGLSVIIAGFIGGMTTDTSASNVGLSAATAATSRKIAYFAGGIFIIMGFIPKFPAIFSIMPAPVMGAIVVFVTAFMIISGFQIMMTTEMTTTKIFIIGISIIFGLSMDMLHDLFIGLPVFLKPVFSSSLTLSTIIAIILNQILELSFIKKIRQVYLRNKKTEPEKSLSAINE